MPRINRRNRTTANPSAQSIAQYENLTKNRKAHSSIDEESIKEESEISLNDLRMLLEETDELPPNSHKRSRSKFEEEHNAT